MNWLINEKSFLFEYFVICTRNQLYSIVFHCQIKREISHNDSNELIKYNNFVENNENKRQTGRKNLYLVWKYDKFWWLVTNFRWECVHIVWTSLVQSHSASKQINQCNLNLYHSTAYKYIKKQMGHLSCRQFVDLLGSCNWYYCQRRRIEI